MKKFLLAFAITLGANAAWAQENVVSLSGGYAFATGDEVQADLSGWRINGVYELSPLGSKISHGVAFGYANVSGSSTIVGDSANNVSVNSWPLYYQPKITFGAEKFQVFAKGAIG